jgi:hypothetical protein
LIQTKRALDNACAEIANTIQKSIDDLKGATLGFAELAFDERAKQLLPWLSPFTESRVEMTAQLAGFVGRFNTLEPLAGQSVIEIDTNICDVKIVSKTREDLIALGVDEQAIGTLIPDILIMNVILDEVHFQEGSLYAWIKLHIKVLTLAASLLGPTVTIANPAIIKAAEHEVAVISLHHRVESAINKSQFVKYRNLMFSEDELRRTAGMAFNYDERGISKDERRRRIALVQLALRIDLDTNLVIDGELGQETTLHLNEFGKRHNCPPSVRNPFFAAALRDALVPKPLF